MKGKTVGYIVYRPKLNGGQWQAPHGTVGQGWCATLFPTRRAAQNAIRATERLEADLEANWSEQNGKLAIQRVVSQEP